MQRKHDVQRWLTVRSCSIAGVIVFTVLCLSVITWGQKGIGDETGMARSGLRPAVARISGRVEEVRTHPCEHTTGRADLGTHLIVKGDNNQSLNVHLGPALVVADGRMVGGSEGVWVDKTPLGARRIRGRRNCFTSTDSLHARFLSVGVSAVGELVSEATNHLLK